MFIGSEGTLGETYHILPSTWEKAGGRIILARYTGERLVNGYHTISLSPPPPLPPIPYCHRYIGVITKVSIHVPPISNSLNVAFLACKDFDSVRKVSREEEEEEKWLFPLWWGSTTGKGGHR